mmetsp:Transcript_32457/g.100421  ORF Transcript_32457/g.100421 Transcript_32457/m.100421 type:complete len:212 (-) Transcript_32457:594-1229(-)
MPLSETQARLANVAHEVVNLHVEGVERGIGARRHLDEGVAVVEGLDRAGTGAAGAPRPVVPERRFVVRVEGAGGVVVERRVAHRQRQLQLDARIGADDQVLHLSEARGRVAVVERHVRLDRREVEPKRPPQVRFVHRHVVVRDPRKLERRLAVRRDRLDEVGDAADERFVTGRHVLEEPVEAGHGDAGERRPVVDDVRHPALRREQPVGVH